MKENPLKSYSKNAGVSLASIAAKMGVHRSILTRLSKGEQSTSLESAIKLKRATGGQVSADALGDFLFPEDTSPEEFIKSDSPSALASEESSVMASDKCAEMEQSPQF